MFSKSAVIRIAYDVTAYRVAGPEWLDLERYTITAKARRTLRKTKFERCGGTS